MVPARKVSFIASMSGLSSSKIVCRSGSLLTIPRALKNRDVIEFAILCFEDSDDEDEFDDTSVIVSSDASLKNESVNCKGPGLHSMSFESRSISL